MKVIKPVGPGASSRKYDLLTALGTLALSAQPGEQRLILRLMVAVTARYNWTSDTLAVGQTELARMWSVDARTVKRAMAEYRSRGWLRLKRQPARGRVAEYGLGLEALMQATRPVWAAVGPDFEARLSPATPMEPVSNTVVPFPVPATDSANLSAGEGTVWPQALRILSDADPAIARAWLGGLREEGVSGNVLMLAAPGRYQANYLRTHLMGRLLGAVRHVNPGIAAVEIGSGAG
ncbi:MAG: hypothetical protein ACK4GT_05600 [Pararhodobacter sp.]